MYGFFYYICLVKSLHHAWMCFVAAGGVVTVMDWKINEGMRRTELIDRIRETMGRTAPGAEVILYGSEARGEARPDSDIDLLVLLDEASLPPERELEIIRPLYELEVQSGIVISSLVMLRKVWDSVVTPFTVNVRREGIVL